MTTAVDARSSRRAVLAGAIGGIGVLAAQALGRPAPAQAEGESIVVGGEYTTAQSRLYLKNQANDADVLVCTSSAGGIGVFGASYSNVGVSGNSTTNTGVLANSTSGYGVFSYSGEDVALYGYSNASGLASTLGWSHGNSSGVFGYSGASVPVGAKAKTGVFGYAAQDSSSRGVWGQSTTGHGVHGIATSGWAGYFVGKVYTTSFHEMKEVSAPSAPAANHGRLFMRDNGSGKSQLCVRFSSGAVQVLATQP